MVSTHLLTQLVEIEANLGRLRFLRLGSILAPIKRPKVGGFLELSLVESADSPGAEKAGVGGSTPSLATTFQSSYAIFP
jgi:hypothetical protein